MSVILSSFAIHYVTQQTFGCGQYLSHVIRLLDDRSAMRTRFKEDVFYNNVFVNTVFNGSIFD